MLALDGNPLAPGPAERSRSGRAASGIARLLETARVTLGADVAFVTSLDGVNQTFTHVAGAAASFGWQPGSQIPEFDGYCHYVLAGELPNVVPDARHDPLAAVLPATDAAGIGSYVGVPLHLGGGRVYGALCVASHDARTDLGGADVVFMRFLARLIADELGQQERDDLADDAVRQKLAGWLAPGALDIHLQPIVEIAGGQVRGFEALTRFPGRPGSPTEVFAAAATVGVGVALELSAIRTALTLLPRLPVGTYLSVNASPATIQDDGLARLLRTVPAERVLIEVTEHTAFDDHPYFRSHLRKLRRTGARIAMDDTGSGYAGLQTLLSLEPDVIKLDVALVKNVHQDPSRRALIRALVGFAGESGAVLIAEGIETSRDLAALARLGVPLGQGYVIAAPAPLADLLPPLDGEGDDAEICVWPSRKLDMSDV